MLAVALGVLERVHARVFEALAAAPAAQPKAAPPPGLAAWDVRAALQALQMQVPEPSRPSFEHAFTVTQMTCAAVQELCLSRRTRFAPEAVCTVAWCLALPWAWPYGMRTSHQ
jgi:hypothetical protein